jgi:ubiquitin C-terminal hydrolase
MPLDYNSDADECDCLGWKCDRCEYDRPKSQKQLEIWNSGRILIVHLKRFKYNYDRGNTLTG